MIHSGGLGAGRTELHDLVVAFQVGRRRGGRLRCGTLARHGEGQDQRAPDESDAAAHDNRAATRSNNTTSIPTARKSAAVAMANTTRTRRSPVFCSWIDSCWLRTASW